MITSTVPSADIYTDFQGLTRLRAEARTNSPETLRAVAQQFESLFTQMMLQSMRQASLGDDLFGSAEADQYRDMFDQQLALTLSKGRGIGLSDMLVQQLGGNIVAAPATDALGDNPPNPFSSRLFRGEIIPLSIPAATGTRAPQAIDRVHTDATPVSGQKAPGFDGPEDFVQKLWPHAQQAARALGITPKFLLAQAALETGWGQSVTPAPHGSSHNLFGIKAHTSWDGPRASVSTLEYVGGIAVRRNDMFRVYPSPEASFTDYVNFLQANPRYTEALQQTKSPEAFAHALQKAGYATDPNYAHKITSILNGDTLRDAVANLQLAGAQPLTDAAGRP
ncbi:MAG: flagellar assembly peptidoglycan hydrolase FlgJ [Gammaproteobacteria bacterium]|nr:flagellar assembly peptidoglycan hydrolase FlgJ [Gammaproteobacteria bacterium]